LLDPVGMGRREELLAKAQLPSKRALNLHPYYRGKVQMITKCPIRSLDDFSIWYTPGVAAPCKAIAARPELVYEHTNKGNTVAIVTDGTRVLGLGDIGPEAGLPVMEGKALLFKYLGGVDAYPICLKTRDEAELVRAVELLEPSFGGINLEDIAQPKCFRILDVLRARLGIPVWHDDQQGTGTVTLAALYGALAVVGKKISNVRIVLVGVGAANYAIYRMLLAAGVDPRAIIGCDRKGTLEPGRADLEAARESAPVKWRVCTESNGDRVTGGIREALRGADVCIAFSSGGAIQPEWLRAMAKDAIVFACANPEPEVWPWDAKDAGVRVIATGRSDFPNQVNNSLGFPGIFRGVLDVRARAITDGMALAAACELASLATERGLREDAILPRMDDEEVAVREAVAVGLAAQREKVARLAPSADELDAQARTTIRAAREATRALMNAGLIRDPPE
jgi:malate dehydrogenase (oxaloacetate-decarboxylating)